jgi:hypothetical protein
MKKSLSPLSFITKFYLYPGQLQALALHKYQRLSTKGSVKEPLKKPKIALGPFAIGPLKPYFWHS